MIVSTSSATRWAHTGALMGGSSELRSYRTQSERGEAYVRSFPVCGLSTRFRPTPRHATGRAPATRLSTHAAVSRVVTLVTCLHLTFARAVSSPREGDTSGWCDRSGNDDSAT